MYGIWCEIKHANGKERIGWLLNGRDKPARYPTHAAACAAADIQRERTDAEATMKVRYTVMPLTRTRSHPDGS